jgi:hypothetical protein
MTEPTKTVYTKKSPGCEKRDDSRSRPLPYRYRKYGSRTMPNWGFVMRNAVTMRHTCGTILTVKTARLMKTYCCSDTMPLKPSADTATASAVMVLRGAVRGGARVGGRGDAYRVTGGSVQKTSMVEKRSCRVDAKDGCLEEKRFARDLAFEVARGAPGLARRSWLGWIGARTPPPMTDADVVQVVEDELWRGVELNC